MKRRILTLGVVLVLATVLAVPNAVLATNTTDVTGDVVEGYTFTAPSPIGFGNMDPSATPSTGNSTGWLEGNNANGYTVTGVDAKDTNTGYMVSGSNVLTNMLQMGPDASVANTAATVTTFLTTDDITDETVPFYVSQTVEFTDPIATGYSITITFTVTAK